MKILVVSAHPDPASLTNALRGVAVGQLEADGHEVRVTDLYAEDWKSAVDRADFPTLPDAARLRVPAASSAAFTTGTLTADVTTEQAKLLWADALILAFPLWWFSMPAILKGWIDRVYAYGFAYGVGEHSETRWGDRYGEGTLAGKRAMLVVTAGGWETHYGPRGINGPIDDLLFPIQHGVLFYPGYAVLPPFVVYRADSMSESGFAATAESLRARMRALFSTDPTRSGGRTAALTRSRPWSCGPTWSRISPVSRPIWAPATRPDRAIRTAQRGVAASRHGRIVSGRGL